MKQATCWITDDGRIFTDKDACYAAENRNADFWQHPDLYNRNKFRIYDRDGEFIEFYPSEFKNSDGVTYLMNEVYRIESKSPELIHIIGKHLEQEGFNRRKYLNECSDCSIILWDEESKYWRGYEREINMIKKFFKE